jgi:hypothetical protein
MSDRERYPLSWPADWKRTAPDHRRPAQFGKTSTRITASGEYYDKKKLSLDDALARIEYELERAGVDVDTVIVSTNLKLNMRGIPTGSSGEPSDPGVAVYWTHKLRAECMAIDRYTRVADNLAAVAATLEALRAIERHGGAEIMDRAYSGFAQLPASTGRPWYQVLDIPRSAANQTAINFRYRELCKTHHPDSGGDRRAFEELTRARDEALREIGEK